MKFKYSANFDGAKTSRAQAYDKDVSYKDLSQVCMAVKGRDLPTARTMLEAAIAGTHAIAYRSHNTRMGHRSELSGRKGRYPRKASKLVLKLLDTAFANAQSKGLDEKNLTVVHAAAFKQNVYPRYRKYFASGNVLGYGKFSMYSNYTTARLELVLGPKGTKRTPLPTKRQLAQAAKKAKAEAKAKASVASKPAAKAEEKPAAKPEAKAETNAPAQDAKPAAAGQKSTQ